MKHDLKEEIAEFVAEVVQVTARDGVGHLIGLLDRVGRDGGEGLFAVPGAAAGLAQARHDGEKALDGCGSARCLRAHGRP